MAEYQKYLERMDLPQEAVDALTHPAADCSPLTRDAISVLERLPEAELSLVDGGQPVYYYLISAE